MLRQCPRALVALARGSQFVLIARTPMCSHNIRTELKEISFVCLNSLDMSYARNNWVKAIRAFLQQTKSFGKEKVRFVGEDGLGNKYFEEHRPNHQYRKVHRYFIKPDLKDATNFADIANVPPLWDAWLRFRREQPPTPQEMKDNEDYFKFQQELAAKRRAEQKPSQDTNTRFTNLKKPDRQNVTRIDIGSFKDKT